MQHPAALASPVPALRIPTPRPRRPEPRPGGGKNGSPGKGENAPSDFLAAPINGAVNYLILRAEFMSFPRRGLADRASMCHNAIMDPLQELVAQIPTRPQAVAKLRYSHDAMIDQIIAQPGISQDRLAALFGYTPAWTSQIIATDAFQARLAERKNELVDPAIRASIEERFKALVQRSLEVLQQKLSKPADEVSDMVALKAAELGAKALGIGQVAGPTPAPIPAEARLANLANNLTTLLAARRTTVVVEEVVAAEAPK